MLGQYFITSLIIAIAFLLLGALVLSRNSKKSTNKIFFMISLTTGAWLVANSVAGRSDMSTSWLLVVNHITFFFGLLSTFSLAWFSNIFLGIRSGVYWYILVFMNVVSAIISVTPMAIGGVEIVGTTNELEFGVLAPIYLLTVVCNCLTAVGLLIRHRNQYRDVKHSQINLIIGGFMAATFVIMITNVILPSLFKIYILTSIGSFATISIVVAIAMSIISHRLFDVRLIVVRSLGYLLSVFTITTLYVVITFVILHKFVLPNESISVTQEITYTVTAVFLVLTFSSLRSFFDRITKQFFYRDAYDTKIILERVSGIIVGNIDPHRVQKGALGALSEAVRPTYAAFLLAGGNGTLQKGDVIGEQWSVHDPGELQAALRRVGKKITVYDELEEGGGKLRDVLRSEDISVVAPLVTKDETIGYLVLGAKKSGNIYNSQDVGLLNIATNELAVALQNAQRFEEIQAFNITLQEKVTEATRELKKTNRKLVALDEAKDEFISMASHQLRTPLTSIKGYLSMLIEGDLGKVTTTQEKALQDAFGSSQRMVYLIADFLNVSRIKTGKFVIEPKEVDLPQIVNEEISQLREMAAAKDLKLVYEQPGIFPKVQLDENKIRQVMMNMVDNAIYYTPSGGKITIQLYVTGEELLFKVVDTGIGVPKREQHKMFTKFFRADNAKKARPDGTGLGLFMAQKIVVEQGGAVIFESVEGKGSTFGFRFPLAKIKSS